MSNATAPVLTISKTGYDDTKRYWPLIGGATVAATYYTNCMIGKRSDGYAGKFDDSAAMQFLGVMADTVNIVVASDDANGAKRVQVDRPALLQIPIDSGTISRVSNIGATMYAADDNHCSLSYGSYGNIIGKLVDVINTTSGPDALTGTIAVIAPILAPDNNGFSGATTPTSITGYSDPLPVTGKAGVTSTAGGAVNAAGGAGDTTGAGGAVTATGGAGGSSSGSGGAVTLTGGAGSAGNAVGGVASLIGGASNGSGVGAIARVRGGVGGATGAGGAAQLTGGAGGATSGTGGAATVTGGAGSNGNANGGAASVVGGAGNGSGTGGAVAITGGASAGASGTAGSITIDPGAANSGTAGTVTIGGTNACNVIIGSSSFFKLPQTAITTEGFVWYDTSSHVIKYRDNSGAKTVTAS